MADTDTEENKPAMVLPKVLDISTAGMLKTSLLGLIGDGGTVELDVEPVQRVTTPCLQILVAATKSLHRNGGELVFRNVTDEFRDTARILGLSEILGLTEA